MSDKMEAVLTKCFICDVTCVAMEKYRGKNISRNVTQPMRTLLIRLIRVDIETEKEFYCPECAKKIEEYDQVIQLTEQIETELYELYRRKMGETNWMSDTEVLVTHEIEPVTHTKADFIEMDDAYEMNDQYDEMVEYLEEYIPEDAPSEETDMDENLVTVADDEQNEDFEVKITSSTTTKCSARLRRKREISNKSILMKAKAAKRPQTTRSRSKSETTNSVDIIDEDESADAATEDGPSEGRVVCDICGKSYKTKSALSIHMTIHTNKSAHECNICGRNFTQRGALVRHMPMHTGEKPHQCDVCGKRFIHYSSFHMHQMIHTNERRKKCEICGIELRSTSHMTRHMRVHTGEKPFACPVCGQKFAQRYNMRTHYNTHQGIHRANTKKHHCFLCTTSFSRRERFMKHLSCDHGVSSDCITGIFENGIDSEEAQKLIEDLKQNEEKDVFIEYIDAGDPIYVEESVC